MHPYTFFIETPLLENWMQLSEGCISSIIIPTTLVCVTFGSTIPTYYPTRIRRGKVIGSVVVVIVVIVVMDTKITKSGGMGTQAS